MRRLRLLLAVLAAIICLAATAFALTGPAAAAPRHHAHSAMHQSLGVSVPGLGSVRLNVGGVVSGLLGGSARRQPANAAKTSAGHHPAGPPARHTRPTRPTKPPRPTRPTLPTRPTTPAPVRTHPTAPTRPVHPAARHPVRDTAAVHTVSGTISTHRSTHRAASASRNATAHAKRAHRAKHTRHRALGAQLITQVARPGSPAQILTLLVVCCAVGTAFVVSLGRRRETSAVRVRRR